MSKFIVTVFDNEKAAYDGSRALRELYNEGSIVVYAAAIISKDENGEVQIKDGADEGPIGTATGMLIGSLIGAFGGPAGMAVGAYAGSLSGWMVDLYNVGVSTEFLDDVASVLTPGKYAVVAEVAESWTAPLDTRMEELGGTVFRRWRIDVEDEQIERDIEATNRELDELEEEWSNAVGEAKEKLKVKVDATRDKLQALNDKADKKMASLESEANAKIEKLDEQISKATDDLKTKFEKRREELKADFDKRIAKLKEANQTKAEAVS